MCAVHTLPYLSHKMVKIMLLFFFNIYSNSGIEMIINNVWVLILVNYSSCQPFLSIYNLTICVRIILTRF